MPWLKLHTDRRRDFKIRSLMKKVEDARGIWDDLLLLCKENNRGNMVSVSENVPFTVENLAEELLTTPKNMKLFLNNAKKLGMIEVENGFIFIINWEKRQYEDGGRLRKFREKQRTQSETEVKRDRNADETPEQNRTEQTTEQKRTEQTTEQNRTDRAREGGSSFSLSEKREPGNGGSVVGGSPGDPPLPEDIPEKPFPPEWRARAQSIASKSKNCRDPEKYALGIMRKWREEGGMPDASYSLEAERAKFIAKGEKCG